MEKKTVKLFANGLAFCVPLILILPIAFKYFFGWDFTPEQYLGYGIGMASPLAALSGYLFVYLSFLHQTEQFEFDKNEKVFAQYLSNYQDCLNNLEFTSEIKIGTKRGEPVRSKKTESGKKALEFLVLRIEDWILYDWGKYNSDNPVAGIIPKRIDYNRENLTRDEAKMLISAVAGEKAFGQYFTILKFLFDHSKNSNFKSFLGIFESLISYEEKVFLFHYCPLILEDQQIRFLKENNFLQSFSKKHWSKFFNRNFW